MRRRTILEYGVSEQTAVTGLAWYRSTYPLGCFNVVRFHANRFHIVQEG